MASGRLTVTGGELRSAIADLTEKNEQFRTKVGELETLQQELASQWQGDANTAFNNAFQSDKGQWSAFQVLVSQYIQALETILKIYEQAEETNRATASNRTY